VKIAFGKHTLEVEQPLDWRPEAERYRMALEAILAIHLPAANTFSSEVATGEAFATVHRIARAALPPTPSSPRDEEPF